MADGIVFLLLVFGLVIWLIQRSSFKKGFAQAIADKEEFARQKLAKQSEKMQWVYEDSTNPQWRYSKVTGETQKRYKEPSSLSQLLNPNPPVCEWRSVAPTETVKRGGK